MLKNIEDIDNRKTLKVALIQPNIDPFEKWGAGTLSKWESFNRQFEKLLNETKALKKENVNLVVWPETAIPFYLLLPQSEQYYQRLRKDIDSLQIGIFTGIPHAEFVDEQNASVTADRIPNTNIYYETYNSAILIQPKVPIGPIYKKVILVPYAERVPHAELFKFLIEPLKWSVGISSWGKGMDTVVFVFFQKDSMKFSGMICYESVYPHFVREFSKRGAEFLTIITNDSWYGNTSGPYQHSAYASFRAVENRKWIIRCANGGISGFIDPTGRIHQQSTMYQSIVLIDNIIPNNKSTFYIKFGDVFAQFCFGVAGMGLICAGIFWITRKGKKSYG
jgi:apolipoprotein N-acyltransferase